jgi:hypothetical protein
MSLASLLDKHVKKEDILEVNRGLGIAASGTKADLIKALLSETKKSPTRTLALFNKEVLMDVCLGIGSTSSGTKEQIINRIYSKELRSVDPT